LHENYAAYINTVQPERTFAFTTKANRPFSDVSFCTGDALVFGPETRGLPDEFLANFDAENRLRIPMRAASRSLNIANAVAIAIYEGWRQINFEGGR